MREKRSRKLRGNDDEHAMSKAGHWSVWLASAIFFAQWRWNFDTYKIDQQ